MTERFKTFIRKIYHDLITINDTPHRIAGGFAVGVFLGILPGAGPVAAVVLAWICRVNRVAAFVGGLLTNSWLSLVTLALAIKIGAALTDTNAQALLWEVKELWKNFHWRELLDASILEILKPIFLGYVVIALTLAFFAYLAAYRILLRREKSRHH